MKVLIAGANGYLGKHVTELFLNIGHDVSTFQRVHTEGENRKGRVTSNCVHLHGCFDIVINCARPHWSEHSPEEICRLEQALMSELNLFANEPAIKVHTSGVWLFGHASKEELKTFTFNPLEMVQLDVESVQHALAQRWHVVYCPSLIYGGGNCQLKRILAEKSESRIDVALPSTGYNQYVHVVDVARFYLNLTQAPDLQSRQHFIAEEKGYSPLQFAELLKENGVVEQVSALAWSDYEAKYSLSAVDIEKLNLNLPISPAFSATHTIANYVAQCDLSN